MSSGARILLIVEVLVCFALPAIHLVPFGVLSLILMIPMALQGASFAFINALVTIAGCLGLYALVVAITFIFSGKCRSFAASWFFKFSAGVSVLALWVASTGQFTEFSFDVFVLFMAGLPTLATIHIVWLVQEQLRSTAA